MVNPTKTLSVPTEAAMYIKEWLNNCEFQNTTSTQIHKCKFCSETFNIPLHLNKHLNMVHHINSKILRKNNISNFSATMSCHQKPSLDTRLMLPNLNISESQLLAMPFLELSHVLQGLSESEVKKIMDKRRILKNRASAKKSRLKLLSHKTKLELENMKLKKTLNHLKMAPTQSALGLIKSQLNSSKESPEIIFGAGDEIFNDNVQNQKSIESIIIGQNEAEESNKIENDFVVERDECQFCRDVFGNYAHKNFVHNGCYIP